MKWGVFWKAGLILTAVMLRAGPVRAETEVRFQGELRTWLTVESEPSEDRELALRYLPQLDLVMPLSEILTLDGQAMGNLYAGGLQPADGDTETRHEAKSYRFWLRGYTDQAGLRLGLQEISFGPGKLLRSLRWFDQKDSRDLTAFTEGVNAALFRYYFLNNANIWAWSMSGNDERMGLSLLRTADQAIERGGRIQLPLGSGELGISAHSRRAELYSYPGSPGSLSRELQEDRFGIDLFWDLGIGLYLETTYLDLEKNGIIPESQRFLTTGCDYTFDVGDGLGVVLEVMSVDLRYRDDSLPGDTVWALAGSGQISLNLLDQLQMMVFHRGETEATTLQVSWQRTTDDWILSLIGFTSRVDHDAAGTTLFSNAASTGQEGIRLLLQLNH